MANVKASVYIPALEKHLGDGYVYGTVGQNCTVALLKAKYRQYGTQMQADYYQKNGDYTKGLCARWLNKWVADCSGLIKAVRRDLTGVFRDVSAQGTYDQCGRCGIYSTMPLIPGCALFMWNAARRRMGHVGVYVGDGWVVQSAGVRYGVIKTKLSGWTHWGLLDWMDYDISAESGSAPGGGSGNQGDDTNPKPGDLPYPIELPAQVGIGNTGYVVKKLQTVLNDLGAIPTLIVDGIFGQKTLVAVYTFQKAHSLPVDGIVGRKTWTALLTPDPAKMPVLHQGYKGSAVMTLQTVLNAKGAKPKLAVDSVFGPKTNTAVVAFQKAHGIAADGVVGLKMWEELLK